MPYEGEVKGDKVFYQGDWRPIGKQRTIKDTSKDIPITITTKQGMELSGVLRPNHYDGKLDPKTGKQKPDRDGYIVILDDGQFVYGTGNFFIR